MNTTAQEIGALYQAGILVLQPAITLPDGTLIRLQLAMPGSGEVETGSDQKTRPDLKVLIVEGVYQQNEIHLLAPLDLPDGTPIRLFMTVQVTMLALLPIDRPQDRVDGTPFETIGLQQKAVKSSGPALVEPLLQPVQTRRTANWQDRLKGIRANLAQPLRQNGLFAILTRLDVLLLSFVMFIYLLVRLIGLTSFPIFFFADEAIHANQGLALFQNGFRNDQGVFLPPYFRNVDKWNLSLSVYLQGASASLFGKSVWVTRATSVSISLLAGIAIALVLRLVFKLRFWWIGPIVLSAIPVWFLHSRTAFEVVLMVSFYACFLCSYLLYRYFHPRFLIATLLFGAAVFYSYTGGQGVLLVSGILLFVSDFGYHRRVLRESPKLTNIAVFTLLLVSVPYLRLHFLYPQAAEEHLRVMNSIWIRNVPLIEKLNNFRQLYMQALSPTFWFLPNNGVDLSRHSFKDWGNISLAFLPFMFIGLLICLREWRNPAYRVVLIAILAAPFTAALAEIHNYRVLAIVIPAAILASLGIDWLAGQLLSRPIPAVKVGLALGCAIWLIGMNFVMLRTALVYGPTWYSDYGMYGQQYGAAQLFSVIAKELQSDENIDFIISPDWANNPDEFVTFFLPKEIQSRIKFISPNDYLTWKYDMKPDTIYVLPASDYDLVQASGKLVIDPPNHVLPYPNGQPGFYFVRMRYVAQIDDILAAEREARSRLVEDTIRMDENIVQVKYSRIDLGSMADLFDHDPNTLIRGFEANPFVLEFDFDTPRPIRRIDLDFWRVDLQMTVTIVTPEDGQPKTFKNVYRNLPQAAHIEFSLADEPIQAQSLRIELLDINASDRARIHITGLDLQ